MWAGDGARAQPWPSTRRGALDADGGWEGIAAAGVRHGLGGFHWQTLRPGPLPTSHQPSPSHILWAEEASAKVPVVSSPPPHRLWPEPQHCQSLPFGALCPQPFPGKEGRQEGSGALQKAGTPDHSGGREEVRFYLGRISHRLICWFEGNVSCFHGSAKPVRPGMCPVFSKCLLTDQALREPLVLLPFYN